MPNASTHPVAVLGVPVDNVTMPDVLECVQRWIGEGGFHQIATANTDFLIKSLADDELTDILRRCDLVVADGMPLVWTSQLLGNPLRARVTGADLVPSLIALSARHQYRVFLLGGCEVSLEGTMAWIRTHHPAANIVGRLSPPHLPLEAMAHEEIVARVNASRPDILLVAFGNPKQEKFLSMHRHRLEVPVCVGIGASFDFLAGTVARAPRWMQDSGLEWCFRLAQEPRRLARRYLGNACGLLRHLPGQWATYTLQSRRPVLPQLRAEAAEDASVLRLSGDFAGPVVARFEREASAVFARGSHLVLDLSRSSYLGPAAMGPLLRLADQAKLLNRELWLTGLQPAMERAVRAARPGPALRIAPACAEAMRRLELGRTPRRVRKMMGAEERRVIDFASMHSRYGNSLLGDRAVSL